MSPVVSYKFTDVSEVLTVSIIRAISDNGGSKCLSKIGEILRNYRVQHLSRRQPKLLEKEVNGRKGCGEEKSMRT
jgi:hypothetical protein